MTPQTKRNNNFAFAGYIIGLIGLLLSWIPFVGLALALAGGAMITVAWITGKDRRKGFLVVGSVILGLALVFSVGSTAKTISRVWDEAMGPMSPQEAYQEYCTDVFARYSATTGALTVDTNPTDQPDGELTDVYGVIEQLNEEFQVPQSVRQQMRSVTEADGWQSCETKRNLILWNYHSTRGFEVSYYKR